MALKEVLWRLKPFTAKDKDGNTVDIGLETKDVKLAEGERYIERLKADGEKVIKVENDGEYLRIYIEE